MQQRIFFSHFAINSAVFLSSVDLRTLIFTTTTRYCELLSCVVCGSWFCHSFFLLFSISLYFLHSITVHIIADSSARTLSRSKLSSPNGLHHIETEKTRSYLCIHFTCRSLARRAILFVRARMHNTTATYQWCKLKFIVFKFIYYTFLIFSSGMDDIEKKLCRVCCCSRLCEMFYIFSQFSYPIH